MLHILWPPEQTLLLLPCLADLTFVQPPEEASRIYLGNSEGTSSYPVRIPNWEKLWKQKVKHL